MIEMIATRLDECMLEAERHVLRFQEIVQRQRAIIDDLRRRSHPTETAERLLRTMERSLRLARDDLAQQERERQS